MNTCLDEGMLQAYLDGELERAHMEACAAHLAACATCAELAHEAEHEYALFATALAPVLDAVPPTERLRTNLEDAIADLQAPRFVPEPAPARLRAWLASFAAPFTITPRRVAAFASFLVAVALTVTLTMMRPQQSGDGIADKQPEPQRTGAPANGGPAAVPTVTNTPAEVAQSDGPAKVNGPISYRNIVHATPKRHRPEALPVPDVKTPAESAPLLPEERSYLTTIATLDAAIKAQGDNALPPSVRAEFERNLALVDQAIIATRVAVRRNPQAADAKEFLRSAYQNKVELLSTVADQTQFIAARD